MRVGLNRASASATFASCSCCAGCRTSGTFWLCRSRPGFAMWKVPRTITSTGCEAAGCDEVAFEGCGAAAKSRASGSQWNMVGSTSDPSPEFQEGPRQGMPGRRCAAVSPAVRLLLLEHERVDCAARRDLAGEDAVLQRAG